MMTEADSDIDREVAQHVMKFYVEGSGEHWGFMRTDVPVDDQVMLRGSEWSPSTRIDHAWEVVEKLRKQGFGINVSIEPDFCLVDIDRRMSPMATDIEADTAPLAICRAALAATKEEKCP